MTALPAHLSPYCRGAMSMVGFWTPKAVMKMLTTTMMKTRPVARLLRKSSLACLAGLLRSYLTVRGSRHCSGLGDIMGPSSAPPERDMPALKHCQKWGLAQAVCYLWLDCCSPACSVRRNSEGPGASSQSGRWEARGPGLHSKAQGTAHTQASTILSTGT